MDAASGFPANASVWRWNKDENGKPAALTFSMSYQICRAYAGQYPDQEQALYEILNLDNPTDFLNKVAMQCRRTDKAKPRRNLP